MPRPALNPGKWQERIDGLWQREFMFGQPGSDGNYRDTLHDEWHSKTESEVVDEMNARYDNWRTLTTMVAEPAPLDEQIRDAEQAARDAERAALQARQAVLDLHDQRAQEVDQPTEE